MAQFGRYPRCDDCKRAVPQVDERYAKGRRLRKCPACARAAGWYEPEQQKPEQQQLFTEE